MTDTRINELRDIEMRIIAIKKEMETLDKRKMEILELNHGSRKARKNMISQQNRDALFAELERKAREHSKEKRR